MALTKAEQEQLGTLVKAVNDLQQHVNMLDRTLGSGLMGTLVLMEMLATAQDMSLDAPTREKALKDAQTTMAAMRRGFVGE